MGQQQAQHDDSDLRLLINCVGSSTDSDARDLLVRFPAALAAIDELGLPALVIGRIAYARYAPAQYCNQIDLVLPVVPRTSEWKKVSEALHAGDAAARRPGSSVRLVLTAALNGAERDLIAGTGREVWLGAKACLATPEHLMTRFLLNQDEDSRSLAVQLAIAHPIDRDRACEIAKQLGIGQGGISATLARAERDRASRWDPFHRRFAPTSQ